MTYAASDPTTLVDQNPAIVRVDAGRSSAVIATIAGVIGKWANYGSAVGQWSMVVNAAVTQEGIMATKNKGGRTAKKPAAKSLKEKRAAKKAKNS